MTPALVLAAAVALRADAAPRYLNVENGSFEEKGASGEVPAGWSTDHGGTCHWVTDAKHGARALHVTEWNDWDWTTISQVIKNPPEGETISAALWGKCQDAKKGGEAYKVAHVFLVIKTFAGKEQKVDLAVFEGTVDWKWYIKKKIVLPKDLSELKVVIGFEGVTAQIWLDRLVLVKGEELPPETITTSEEVRTAAEVLKGAVGRSRTAVRKKAPSASPLVALAEAKAALDAAVLVADDLARETADYAAKAPAKGNTAAKAAGAMRAAADLRARIAAAIKALEEAERAGNEETSAERAAEALREVKDAQQAAEDAERGVTDSLALAGTWGGGLYRTSSATEWQDVNPDVHFPYAGFLAVTGDGDLYTGATDKALYLSQDNGKTWSDPLQAPAVPSGLAFEPEDPNRWVMTSAGGGLWLSGDAGRNWRRAETPTPFLRKPFHVRPATWFVIADGARILKAIRPEGPWTEAARMPRGLKAWDLALKPVSPPVLLAATDAGVAEVADDGTVTFPRLEVSTAWARSLASDLLRVFIGLNGGGVVEWKPEAPELPRARLINPGLGDRNVSALAVSTRPKPEAAPGAAEQGPPVWTERNKGFTSLRVNGVAVNPKDENILYASTQGGMFRTKNSGKEWEPSTSGLVGLNLGRVVVDPGTPDNVYVVPAFINNPGGVQKSADGGKTWTERNRGLTNPAVMWLDIDQQNPSTSYLITWGSGISRTYNGGDSWEEASSGLPSMNGYCVVHGAADPKDWLAGLDAGGLYRLNPDTDKWEPSNKGLTATRVWHVAQDPSDGMSWLAGTPESGLFKSTDGAKSWRQVSKGLTTSDIYRVVYHPKKTGVVYLGSKAASGVGAGGGIYRSTDGGESWAPDVTGLGSSSIQDLLITSSGLVFAATDNGLYWKQD